MCSEMEIDLVEINLDQQPNTSLYRLLLTESSWTHSNSKSASFDRQLLAISEIAHEPFLQKYNSYLQFFLLLSRFNVKGFDPFIKWIDMFFIHKSKSKFYDKIGLNWKLNFCQDKSYFITVVYTI